MVKKGNVDVCPVTKETWAARAKTKSGDCGGHSVYHCLADSEGGKWERCVEKTLVIEGNCPIFNEDGFIDWKPCDKTKPLCPNSSFVSDEVYIYPECFGNNTPSAETKPDPNNDYGNGVGLVIGVALGIMFILSAMAVLAFVLRRRSSNQTPKQELNASQTAGLLSPDEDQTTQRLNSDSTEEIVKEHNVHNGIALLMNDDSDVKSIIVVGKLGNSVSSTSRHIVKGFQHKAGWVSLECRYTDIPNTVEENTIIFVYDWFGTWNDDLCSLEKAKTACKTLVRILDEIRNVKIIVGMRSDIYRKYYQGLQEVDEKITSLFDHEINLDSADVQKDEEYLKYLKEKIQRPCKQNSCACPNLTYEMLRKGRDKVVGMPLKINVIEKYHDLVPDYLDNCDILKAMREHFISIEKDMNKRHLYEWITYICLKGKFTRSESFDASLVQEIGFKITDSSFDESYTELSKYLKMRNSNIRQKVPPNSPRAQYVFWHPFIYICFFHYLFDKDQTLVMRHCNTEAIFELVRTKEAKVSYFEVTADVPMVTLFKARIRSLGKDKEYMHHPLLK